MIRSFLIGLVAGSRALTPLAAVADAAGRKRLSPLNPDFAWLGQPRVSAGLTLLAASELWGDKLRTAPDRIAPAGVVARLLSGGLAGAALAPRGRGVAGALLGAAAAVGAAYLTFAVRSRAMRRFGQRSTGLVEDALTVAAARSIVGAAPRTRTIAGSARALVGSAREIPASWVRRLQFDRPASVLRQGFQRAKRMIPDVSAVRTSVMKSPALRRLNA